MKIKLHTQNSYGDCFEGVLACVAMHLNRHYEWMYLNEWSFQFEPPPIGTPHRLGLALDLHRDKVGPLSKFHGIRYKQQPFEHLDKLRNILQVKLTEGMPIAVRVDAYHCSWDKSFKKYHNTNHIFLLNGLEEETGDFICSDPFYHEWDRLISLEDFTALYAGQYGVFEVKEDISSLIDGIKFFQETLIFLFKEETFDAIRCLAREIEKADNFTQEIEKETAVWFAPLYRRMIEIANSRGRLPRFVIFLTEQYGHTGLLCLLPLLEQIREEWRQVRDLTLKILMTGNRILKDRVAFKINNLAEMEEKAALKLLSI